MSLSEKEIRWLCSLARSSCQESVTEERALEKTERVNKLEQHLLKEVNKNGEKEEEKDKF